jgi:hypothetical protein
MASTMQARIFSTAVAAIKIAFTGLKFFAFFLSGTADGIAAIIYAWANEICAHSAEVQMASTMQARIFSTAVAAIKIAFTSYTSERTPQTCIVLAIWNVPVGLKFFAFFLSGTADGIAAIIYAIAFTSYTSERTPQITDAMMVTAGETVVIVLMLSTPCLHCTSHLECSRWTEVLCFLPVWHGGWYCGYYLLYIRENSTDHGRNDGDCR